MWNEKRRAVISALGVVGLALLPGVSKAAIAKSFSPSITALIEQARDIRGWLIFFGHDVTDSPNEFDMTPGLLEFAASETNRRGLPIMTLDDALDHFDARTNSRRSRATIS